MNVKRTESFESIPNLQYCFKMVLMSEGLDEQMEVCTKK